MQPFPPNPFPIFVKDFPLCFKAFALLLFHNFGVMSTICRVSKTCFFPIPKTFEKIPEKKRDYGRNPLTKSRVSRYNE
jgi:hypothetical protein